MNLLALIPARAGSKSLPQKNIRKFFGKPLLQWSIEAALNASCVDRVVVSTDDLQIARIAMEAGAEVPFMRPPELATDTSPAIDTVLHALGVLPDITDVIVLQPTSPLRTSSDIEGIVEFRNQESSSSAISVTMSNKHPAWMYTLTSDRILEPIFPHGQGLQRQQLPASYTLNGAMYLASRSFLETEKNFLGYNTLGFIMPPERSVDIDTILDWQLAELQMEQFMS